MLLQQLPTSSRTKTADIEASSEERWGPGEYLAAQLIDHMTHLIYVEAFKGTGKSMPKVKPVARPTDILRTRIEQEQARDEGRNKFREMIREAIATGELQPSPEE